MGWESARYKQIQTADAGLRCLKFPCVSRLSTCYSQTIRQMARCPFRARAAVRASAVTPTSRQDVHITRNVAKYQGTVSFHVAEPSRLFLVPVRTVDVALDGYTLVGLSDHISAYICKGQMIVGVNRTELIRRHREGRLQESAQRSKGSDQDY